MAATGQGATFSFTSNRGAFRGSVTRISVASPEAEIVDATGIYDASDQSVLIPTGSWKGGSIDIEYVVGTGTTSVTGLVRGVGQLTFASPGFSVARRVILESASESVAAGDVAKGSMKFRMTDYYGT